MHVDGACITHAFTDAVTPPADLAVGRLIYLSAVPLAVSDGQFHQRGICSSAAVAVRTAVRHGVDSVGLELAGVCRAEGQRSDRGDVSLSPVENGFLLLHLQM